MLYILNEQQECVSIASNDVPNALPIMNDEYVETIQDNLSTLYFETLGNHSHSNKIKVGGYILYPQRDNQFGMYSIVQVVAQHDTASVVQVTCEHVAITDLNSYVLRPIDFTGITLENCLSIILADTGWEVGSIAKNATSSSKFDKPVPTLQALHTILNEFEIEMEYTVTYDGTVITHRKVDTVDKRGNNTGKIFEYTKDLTSVKRIDDSSELVTALVGYGKDGLTFDGYAPPVTSGYVKQDDYVYSEESFQRFNRDGKHRLGVYSDSSDNEVELYNNTLAKLKELEKPKLTFECSVVALEDVAGYVHEKVKIGDTVVVKDFSYNPPLLLEARVVELKRSMDNPINDSVVLGDYIPIPVSNSDTITLIQNQITETQADLNTKENTIIKSNTAPTHEVDKMWLDTNEDLNILKRSTGTAWVKATPTTSSEVNAVGKDTATTDINASSDTALIVPDKIKINGANSLSKVIELDANVLVTGTLSASRIATGSIAVDKLGSTVGSDLNISSNSSIVSKVESDEVISTINQSAEAVKIQAGKIDIAGAVTFSSLDATMQSKVNDGTDAKSTLDTKETGWDSAESLTDNWKIIGKTTIDGGQIEADTVTANQLNVNTLSAVTSEIGSIESNYEYQFGEFGVMLIGQTANYANIEFRRGLDSEGNPLAFGGFAQYTDSSLRISSYGTGYTKSVDLDDSSLRFNGTGVDDKFSIQYSNITGITTLQGNDDVKIESNTGSIFLNTSVGDHVYMNRNLYVEDYLQVGSDGIWSSGAIWTSDNLQVDGVSDLNGVTTVTTAGEAFKLKAGSTGNHTFMGFYADSSSQSLRSGYIGYGVSGTADLTVSNDESGDIRLNVLSGKAVTVNRDLEVADDTYTNGLVVNADDLSDSAMPQVKGSLWYGDGYAGVKLYVHNGTGWVAV